MRGLCGVAGSDDDDDDNDNEAISNTAKAIDRSTRVKPATVVGGTVVR